MVITIAPYLLGGLRILDHIGALNHFGIPRLLNVCFEQIGADLVLRGDRLNRLFLPFPGRNLLHVPFDFRSNRQVVGSQLGQRSRVNLDHGLHVFRENPNPVQR